MAERVPGLLENLEARDLFKARWKNDEIMKVAAMINKKIKMENSVTSVPAILNNGWTDISANRDKMLS